MFHSIFCHKAIWYFMALRRMSSDASHASATAVDMARMQEPFLSNPRVISSLSRCCFGHCGSNINSYGVPIMDYININCYSPSCGHHLVSIPAAQLAHLHQLQESEGSPHEAGQEGSHDADNVPALATAKPSRA